MFTIDDTKNWQMIQAEHHNGGAEFFAYVHRCVQQPRLTRYDRYTRKDKSVTSTWRTDGIAHPSLESAVEALNTQPVFTDAELEWMRDLPTEWTQKETGMMDWVMNDTVRDKGGIEWHQGQYKITDVGLEAIHGRNA